MTCDANCQLTEEERRVIAEMRLLEKLGKRGGILKARWIANERRWEVASTRFISRPVRNVRAIGAVTRRWWSLILRKEN